MHTEDEFPGALNDQETSPSAGLQGRRAFMRASGAVLAMLVSPVGRAAEASILAVRVWPAEDYTRITLEGGAELKFTQQIVRNPERLVLDLEGVEFNSLVQNLGDRVSPQDPYIKLIRAGRNRPGVVRVVVELKREIDPQIFTLNPIGDYGHRLVVDLYPSTPVNPLLALIEKTTPNEAAVGNAPTPERGASSTTVAEKPDGNGRLSRADQDEPKIRRLITVALDPGHGGEDPGAIGHRGSYEKNVTLEIARRLKARIDAEPNMRAMLTRDGDFFVPLHHRVNKARRVQADLFVSIHADAFIRPDAHGSSVFVLSERGASSAAARWLAKKENDADLIGGVRLAGGDGHLARTLLDLSQTAAINDSLKVGRAVLDEIGNINRLHKSDVEQAGFAVLKAPDIPSILVETAFISNPEEEARLNDDAYQEKLAQAIIRGIKRYFSRNPPTARSKLALLD